MALNGSGPISLGGSTTGESIAVELGLSPTAQISLNDAGVRDLADVPSGAIVMPGDFYGKSNIIPAPVGLIVPYTSASAPTGWTRFTSSDNRFIVGAGTSYAAGSTGGSTSVSAPATMSSTGAHNPSETGAYWPGGGRTGGSTTSAGSHSHTATGSATAQDVYKNFVLIKCTSAGVQIPANAMLLASTSLSGLSNVESSTDRFLRAASSYGGTGGSASWSGSATSSSAGSHNHGTYSSSTTDGPDNPFYGTSSGGHTHPISFSGTLNTKRMYLSAWTNASSAYDLVENGIAMWESGTPPSGWYICNGANGTPDLRDYFVRFGTTGNHGLTSGNNSSSWSASSSGGASHTHYTRSDNASSTSSSHGPFAWSHTHTASGSVTIVPPYYALYFIQYAG